MKLRNLILVAGLALGCLAAKAQSTSPYKSIVVNWGFTANAPACPTTGTPTNCILGFNTTITLGGTTVYSLPAGYASGALSPTSTTYTWTPSAGVGFGTYTVTVTTMGYDNSGNAVYSTPAVVTAVAGLTTVNPPSGLSATVK